MQTGDKLKEKGLILVSICKDPSIEGDKLTEIIPTKKESVTVSSPLNYLGFSFNLTPAYLGTV